MEFQVLRPTGTGPADCGFGNYELPPSPTVPPGLAWVGRGVGV